MTWIKSHWQTVLICLLTIFCFNKCAQSCNRQTELDQLTAEYSDYKSSQDSIISVNIDSIKTLNNEIIVKNSKIEILENTLEDLKVSTDALTKVNDNLSRQKTQVIIKQETKE